MPFLLNNINTGLIFAKKRRGLKAIGAYFPQIRAPTLAKIIIYMKEEKSENHVIMIKIVKLVHVQVISVPQLKKAISAVILIVNLDYIVLNNIQMNLNVLNLQKKEKNRIKQNVLED